MHTNNHPSQTTSQGGRDAVIQPMGEVGIPIMEFRTDGEIFKAEECIHGVFINPVLPEGFDDTWNENRPASHQKWWHRPFIQTASVEDWDRIYADRDDVLAEAALRNWKGRGRRVRMQNYPSGERFEVRCLDGEVWDRTRTTSRGMFARLDEALKACGGEIEIPEKS